MLTIRLWALYLKISGSQGKNSNDYRSLIRKNRKGVDESPRDATHSRDGNRTLLLHAHPPHLGKICQAQTDLSDAFLHEGCHAVLPA
jgi:hypothetical protein